MVYKDIAFIYDVFQNFMTCSFTAREMLQNVSDIDRESIETVTHEITQNIYYVQEELVNLRAGYPSLMYQVDTDHCAYYVLRQLAKYYQGLEQTG